MRKWILTGIALITAGLFWLYQGVAEDQQMPETQKMDIFSVAENKLIEVDRVSLSDEEWKRRLSPAVYRVLRHHDTERPFTGEYCELPERAGIYQCAGCGTDLFVVDAKFESGTGWPSFYEPIHPNNIGRKEDRGFGMTRIEVHCARCGGHLGHVFEDGPPPSGLRYCINSASLTFVPKAD